MREVTIDNVGAVGYDWVIEGIGVIILAYADMTATRTVNSPAGTCDASCTIPGHAEAGMVGTVDAE